MPPPVQQPTRPQTPERIHEPGSRTREIRIATPTPFNGDRKKTLQFISEVLLYIGCNEEIYNTDKKQIAFLLSYLKDGPAADWKLLKVREFHRNNGPGWPTWGTFIEDFNDTFSPVDTQGDARIQLRNHRQTGEADNYISEFQLLASNSGITEDAALIEYFIEGLNPKIVEKMFDRAEVPTKISDWYKYAALYDSNYRRGRAVAGRMKAYNESRKNHKNSFKFFRTSTTTQTRDPNAMDVDRLSIEEQQEYRRKGQCYNCGRTGHVKRDCRAGQSPQKSNGEQSTPKQKLSTRIRALMQEAGEQEANEALDELEKEGFA
jgi:hypothetical protein